MFRENRELIEEYAIKIFPSPLPLSPGRGVTEGRGRGEGLHLFVKGTNFQIKVWEALLRLPEGNVTTYQTIATKIGNPKSLQAVGSAVGANHIAYLIPCHRVIRKSGEFGNYLYGSARKKAILMRELVVTE